MVDQLEEESERRSQDSKRIVFERGIVHINGQSVDDEPQVPFGGVKDSGWGRLGGYAALEEFTELRWISMQRTQRQYPF